MSIARAAILASGFMVSAALGGACTSPLEDIEQFLAPCGNGQIEGAETCDDANQFSDDGCSAACRVEDGFTCTQTSTRTSCEATCGDGIRVAFEGCDDGNMAAGDGCSEGCRIEAGFDCSGEPSICVAICGDGVRLGTETCDDNNLTDGDGCSQACRVEQGFSCDPMVEPSVCTPVCGDGRIVFGETCDDGNATSGDGCDAVSCNVEPGWNCTPSAPSVCQTVCGDGMVVATREGCDDFGTTPGDGCDENCRIEEGFTCVTPPGGGSNCTPHWVTRNAAFVVPARPTVVWTGAEMILYGGGEIGNTAEEFVAAWDPVFDAWRSIALGVGRPGPRVGHVAVWSGGEMIVFGGHDPNAVLATGSRLDPFAELWTPIAAEPGGGRAEAVAVWTGTEMLVLGGIGPDGLPRAGGDRYDPATDSWVPTSTLAVGTSTVGTATIARGRRGAAAAWLGDRMLIHGGVSADSGGGAVVLDDPVIYDLGQDRWIPLPPSPLAPRSEHAAVYTGQEVVVFGGFGRDGSPFQDGAIFDPGDRSWTLLPEVGAPSARGRVSGAFGNGDAYFLGGAEDGTLGARYDLIIGDWQPVTDVNGPSSAPYPTLRFEQGNLYWLAGAEVGVYAPPPNP